VSNLCFFQVNITRSSRRGIVKASLVDFKAMTCISGPSSRSPVMTKRASVSASSSKSPTPGLKSISDSPSDSGSVPRSQRLTLASALTSLFIRLFLY